MVCLPPVGPSACVAPEQSSETRFVGATLPYPIRSLSAHHAVMISFPLSPTFFTGESGAT